MSVPIGVRSEPQGPAGYTYAGVLVRVGDLGDPQAQVIAALRRIRLSGWVAPPEDGWLVVVTAGAGTVAAGRRDVVGVAEALARTLELTTVAVRVYDDRQLVLVAWESEQDVARYVSDPSREPRAQDDVLPDPFGSEGADALASACGRPRVAEELGELLGEPLNPEEEIESERLSHVLRLLGLPSWLVTAWRLPRDMPIGPARRDLVRLNAGHSGPLSPVAARAANLVRRWRPPPPVLLDPPRGAAGDDGSAMWL